MSTEVVYVLPHANIGSQVLNESIPHLGAGFFGHVLGTAWAGYRVYSTHGLMDRYRNHIVPKACNGRDIMGDWWENRIDDGVRIPLTLLFARCSQSFQIDRALGSPSCYIGSYVVSFV